MYVAPNSPTQPGGPNPSDLGWIYVAYDVRQLDECKIGLTRGPLWNRMTETTNPYYALFVAFRVPSPNHFEIHKMERFLQHKAGIYPIPHFRSGNDSEWYAAAPESALLTLVEVFPNCFGGTGPVRMDSDGADFTECIYLPELNAERLQNFRGAFIPSLLEFHANGGNWLSGITPEQTKRYRNVYFVQAPANLMDRICFYLHRSGVHR
jgi:hypothetical protein